MTETINITTAKRKTSTPMNASIVIHNQKEQSLGQIIIIFGFVLYLVTSLIFVLFGQVNADEGWYLYASKLVYEGQYPYQDFAYTQTPLLPFIYGIVQSLFSPGIYSGRITTVILSTITLCLSMSVARRHAGETAGGITALLWATFTYGIYYQSIVKTYALTTMFFMLTFFILATKINQEWKYILATTFVLLATLTRLSALLFAIPFIIYAFVAAGKKTKVIIVALCFTALTWILLLSLPNPEAARWNLWGHHTAQWRELSTTEKLLEIVQYRVPILFYVFPSYFLLFFTMLFVGRRQIPAYLKRNPIILLTTIGLLFFALPHLVTGGFHAEYFVPFILVLFPIAAIIYVKMYNQQQKHFQIILQAMLLSTLIIGTIRGGSLFINFSRVELPVEDARKVAAIVAENSNSDDEILALEALWVAIESGRQTLPNMTMAQFSLHDGDTNEVNHLKLINDQIILDHVERGTPKVVVLTDLDWKILQKTGSFERIVTSLDEQYELQFEKTSSDQDEADLQVYVRRVDN